MNIVGKIFHTVRKFFGIGYDLLVFVSLTKAPAVVNDDIFVAAVLESAFDNKIGSFHNDLFVDVLAEGVP